ncbi:zinc ribbon domain-containing protein [Paenisporosarcina sp. TG-14]|uniref:zinc ribbon domain-containing protein n=1 Tax=Paenisporosarcina sp. TG-14 TaxID=1231057 RepID=UPI00031D8A92|nr:zinc ribbon domain-containing protein [Paenisporosarcina sp. TG-14]
MYCPHCGEQIDTQAEICPKCGVRVSSIGEDKPNIAVNILSFCCVPLLGIVLFFVWKDSKPVAAKSALIWALVSIGIWIIISLLFGFFSAVIVEESVYRID